MPWAVPLAAASVAAFIGRTPAHPCLGLYAVRRVACGVTVCRVPLPGVASLSNPRPHFYPRNAIVRREFFSAGSSSTLSEDGESRCRSRRGQLVPPGMRCMG